MTVRCSQCGHESDPRYRFCGMCGAKLPPPPPPPPPEPITTRASEPVPASSEEPIRRVSGPSFLGLAEEPSSSVTYLLEDDLSESHWGRTVVLIAVLGALGFAGWHWRSNVREYVSSRLAQKPQTEQASSPGGAQSDTASETAGQSPTTISPVESQNTAPTPAAPAPNNPATPAPATTENPAQPATTSAPSATNSQAAGAPVNPAANSSSTTTPPPQKNASAAPGETPSGQGPRAGGDTSVADTETPAPAATSKRAKPKVKEPEQTDETSAADALETQGERYLYGTGVPVSCDRAQRSLEAAADQGSAKADSVLGTMYATGHCVNRDSPLAYRWFARALQKDPSNARLERDLQVLWNQMTPDERQIAMRH